MSRRAVGPGIAFTPGDGLRIQSEDQQFAIGLSFRFQLLYTLLDRDPATGEIDHSLQVRRARLQLRGHAFGQHNRYKLELAVSPTDVDLKDQVVHTSPLLEAYTEFDQLRDLTVRAGQYKVPFDRMRVTSDMARQLVDYSSATTEFSLDRDIGVEVMSNDFLGAGLLRYHAGVFSGKGRNSFAATDAGLMYIGRVEVLPLGLYDDSTEGDFERTGPRLSVGGSFARITDARRDRGTLGNAPLDAGGTTDFNLGVADLSFKVGGFSVVGGFYSRAGERNPGKLVDASGKAIVDASGKALTAPSPTRDGTAWMAQVGYLVPTTSLEFAGRYVSIKGRSETGHDALKDSNELGGGASYYFAQHHLKLQTDFFRFYSKGDLSNGYNQARLQLQFVM